MRISVGHLFIAAPLVAVALPTAAQTLPEGNGKQVVESHCNSCHQFFQRVGNGYTRDGWLTVMRMMVNHGMSISPDEHALVTDYLVRNFPEKNKAPAVLVWGPAELTISSWRVPTPGSRPHDPLAAADGSLWYTGQMANVLGRLDPKTGVIQEFPLKTPHGGPHGLVEDRDGNIWYTANAAGLIGKLDPKTGAVTEYPMPDPEVRDPHTLIFDRGGILWFSAQNANRIGRLDPKSGEIKLVAVPTAGGRPYGLAINSKGIPFFVEFGTNKVGSIDPQTLAIREYPLPRAEARPRRIAISGDDAVWYTDFAKGYLGRLDPATGKATEWLSPSGPRSEPYGISAINGVIWYSESGAFPNTVVRFDPKTEKFQSWALPTGGNIVRNTDVTRDGNFVLANSLTNEVTLVEIRDGTRPATR